MTAAVCAVTRTLPTSHLPKRARSSAARERTQQRSSRAPLRHLRSPPHRLSAPLLSPPAQVGRNVIHGSDSPENGERETGEPRSGLGAQEWVRVGVDLEACGFHGIDHARADVRLTCRRPEQDGRLTRPNHSSHSTQASFGWAGGVPPRALSDSLPPPPAPHPLCCSHLVPRGHHLVEPDHGALAQGVNCWPPPSSGRHFCGNVQRDRCVEGATVSLRCCLKRD